MQTSFMDKPSVEKPLYKNLSKREKQVAVLICKGNTAKDTGILLNISHRTVEKHRMSLYRKTNIHDISTLIRYCLKNGIVSIKEFLRG